MKTIKQILTLIIITFFTTNVYSQCADLPTDALSWWTGESNANDIIGTNNGTELNGVNYTNGMVGDAFLFNGIDDLVLVPDSASLDLTGDMTLMAWVKRIGYDNPHQTVICKGAGFVPNDEPAVFVLRFEFDLTEVLFEDVNGNNIMLNGPAFEDSAYHHYVYVREGNEHRLYVDGFLFDNQTFTSSPASTVGLPLTIGAQYHNPSGGSDDYDFNFHGEVDEIILFNRGLSTNEVTSIFDAGVFGACQDGLSVDEVALTHSDVMVYPNPFSEATKIQLEKPLQNANLVIIDMYGREVKRKTALYGSEVILNAKDLNSGVYMLIIQQGTSKVSTKIVVK